MQYKVFFKSDIAKLFYIYTISNIFMLLNFQGIYWDDWVLKNHSYETIHNIFVQAGGLSGIPIAKLHHTMLNIGNGVFIYRLSVFITFFLSGIFIYKILSKHTPITKMSAFWISLIYLTLPLNSAKIALINAPVIFYLFIFFAAFYLLTEYISKAKSIWFRISILFLFFLSFAVSSLLVFYAIVLFYLLYYILKDENIKKESNKVIYLIKTFILKYSDFILLPIAFYIIKSIYFVPTGLYAGYNKITFSFLKIAYIIMVSFKTSVFDPLWIAFQTSLSYWYVFIIIFITLFFFLKNKTIQKKQLYDYRIVVSLGIIVYVLAVFPYAVVSKLPQLTGWESRHQVLIPLGISFILYALIVNLSKFNKKVPTLVFSLFLTAFIVQNIYNGYRYIQDWYYQVALEENFKSSKIIQENTTFVTSVALSGALANGRNLSFYEQNGRLKKVFGNANRLMVEQIRDIEKYKKYKKYKQYNFSTWTYTKPVYIQIRSSNLLESQPLYIWKMLYFQFTDQLKFKKMAKPLIMLKTK